LKSIRRPGQPRDGNHRLAIAKYGAGTPNRTPTDPDALLSFVRRGKENSQEPPPPSPKRGKKRDFSELSFLLLATIASDLARIW